MPLTQAKGFYLLEVLITLLVMAIGMLGIASMLLLAHKTASSSYLKQQAIQASSDIIEKIGANRQAAISGAYTITNLVSSGNPSLPTTPAVNCISSACNATQLASYESWAWLSNLLTFLPNGAGAISTSLSGSNTIVTVTVQWNDTPAQNILGAAGQVSAANTSIARFSIGTSL